MGRHLLLFASLAMGIALATTGCRSCSSNYDYAPPVANGYCDACGTHRCGSNSGGCATGDCMNGDCATGDCSTCGPSMNDEVMGEYATGEVLQEVN